VTTAATSRRAKKKRRAKSEQPEQSTTLRLLPLAEFCDRIGMSVFWGRKQVRARKIAAVRIGQRRICIPETELARFIAERIIPAKVSR